MVLFGDIADSFHEDIEDHISRLETAVSHFNLPLSNKWTLVRETEDIDGDLGISLCSRGIKKATSTLTFGLGNYYQFDPEKDLFDTDLYEPHFDAIYFCEDLYGLTQMQGTSDITRDVPYREILFSFWKQFSEECGFQLDFILPFELILWKELPTHYQEAQPFANSPKDSVLQFNYDALAEMNNYIKDQDSGIYLRPDSPLINPHF